MRWCTISVRRFQRRFAGAPAASIIEAAVSRLGSRAVVTTSFGTQSAVLLHMVRQIAPRIPVVWIDTGYLPPETYQYAHRLSREFDLNLHTYQSELSPARMEALYGKLWEQDDPEALDRYHQIRKVDPLHRALRELEASAWIAGVRRSQTDHRRTLQVAQRQGQICKIHPLLEWSDADVAAYFDEHHLPRHPLSDQGYTHVGDAHLNRPASGDDSDPHATRFAGRAQECGLHTTAVADHRIEIPDWSP
ncbi:MAG: phosphoadenylyl-sulfate reductase [Alkalispirochaeta sp.]